MLIRTWQRLRCLGECSRMQKFRSAAGISLGRLSARVYAQPSYRRHHTSQRMLINASHSLISPGRADTKKYGGVKDPMRTDLEDANIIAQLSTPRETLPPSSDEAELASMFCRCWFPRKINPLYRRRSKLALRTVRTAITLQKTPHPKTRTLPSSTFFPIRRFLSLYLTE